MGRTVQGRVDTRGGRMDCGYDFTSLRDGFHCLWAQRLRPDTKQPIGTAFAVYHAHSARLSMNNTGFLGLEMAVARDQLFINLGELSGNIWTTILH